MQSTSPDAPSPRRRASSSRNRRRVDAAAFPAVRIVVAAAVVGLLVSGYLAAVDLSGGSTLCLQGSDCDAVRASQYGRILGVTLPALGLVYFGVVLGLALTRRASLLPLLHVFGGLGLGAAALFLGIQGAVLGAWCPYCLVADAAALVIAWRMLLPLPGPSLLSGASGAALGVAVLLGGYELSPSPTVAEATDEASLLADHLKQNGAMFYGAYWCPHCQNQKSTFGAAASRLPYVECDPRGSSARPDLCREAGVRAYPTWVINDERREGEVSLSDLKQLSKFGS